MSDKQYVNLFQEFRMDRRIIVRYSMSFKQQVVRELESGRFSSISEVKEHYGITGASTIQNWLVRKESFMSKGGACGKT